MVGGLGRVSSWDGTLGTGTTGCAMHPVGLQQTTSEEEFFHNTMLGAKEDSSFSEFLSLPFFPFVCLREAECCPAAHADL